MPWPSHSPAAWGSHGRYARQQAQGLPLQLACILPQANPQATPSSLAPSAPERALSCLQAWSAGPLLLFSIHSAYSCHPTPCARALCWTTSTDLVVVVVVWAAEPSCLLVAAAACDWSAPGQVDGGCCCCAGGASHWTAAGMAPARWVAMPRHAPKRSFLPNLPVPAASSRARSPHLPSATAPGRLTRHALPNRLALPSLLCPEEG